MKGSLFPMIRRVLCVLLCAVLLAGFSPAFAAKKTKVKNESTGRYHFDLTFRLNPEAFPAALRPKMEGYASLVNRIGLRGTVAWTRESRSGNLSATLYFRDNPSLSYSFRIFGNPNMLYFTSPMINKQYIAFNMSLLTEFAHKVKVNLNVDMPYLSLLYPYAAEEAFSGLISAWNTAVGTYTESGKVTTEQLSLLEELLASELENNMRLQWWITALTDGCKEPSAVESEFANLPGYYRYAAGSNPLTVTVSGNTQVWSNAQGTTLFTREESADSLSLLLTSPATKNGYTPFMSLTRRISENTCSFSLKASLERKAKSAAPAAIPGEESAGETAAEDEEQEEEYVEAAEDTSSWPDLLMSLAVSGSGIPLGLPAESDFALSASVRGTVCPDFSLQVQGETKKDGSVSVSLRGPDDKKEEQAAYFTCSGKITKSKPTLITDYSRKLRKKRTYQLFTINEEKLAAFKKEVVPPLARNLLSFVAEAPVAACQTLLDDLIDMGILDMLMD